MHKKDAGKQASTIAKFLKMTKPEVEGVVLSLKEDLSGKVGSTL